MQDYVLTALCLCKVGGDTGCRACHGHPDDPRSWRFWDGHAFDGKFTNPFIDLLSDTSSHQCPPLDQNDIGHDLDSSITHNTVMDRYALIGIVADRINGREVWGWHYSLFERSGEPIAGLI